MFSPAIVESDAFLDMPSSSQALYFHLGMYADDDGFVNPRKIMRLSNASDDDLKVLVAKRFVLPFHNGVVVIKHWRINNLVRKDWYRPTQYIEELKSLTTKENGSYTEGQKMLVNESVTVRSRRLGKVRLGKDKKENTDTVTIASDGSSKDIEEIIYLFKEVNPAYSKFFARNPQRDAVKRLLVQWPRPKLDQIIRFLPQTNSRKYWPKITTPLELEDNMGKLQARFNEEKVSTKNKVML